MLVLVCFATSPAIAHDAERIPVTVFGDGDPYNGFEDSRKPVISGQRAGGGYTAAGAIECDGKVRGTGMVVDTRELAPGLEGVVLVTAAHVLYDLDRKQRFKRCNFYFMALDSGADYHARIDLDHVRAGRYDPSNVPSRLEFGEGDWAFLYVPRPWRNYRPEESLPLHEFRFTRTERFQQGAGKLRLVALDSSSGVISESGECTVIESNGDDIGGGAWRGQLLDDCDSGGGASGGGFVAVIDTVQYLVGIRTGSHWSGNLFPAGDFPGGPPDGSVWDARYNTNFGRAIDQGLLFELSSFVKMLGLKNL